MSPVPDHHEIVEPAPPSERSDAGSTPIPTGPNHTQPTWTATGPVGTHLPIPTPEFEACDDCSHLYERSTLTPIRTEEGSSLSCWPCIERRRDEGLVA